MIKFSTFDQPWLLICMVMWPDKAQYYVWAIEIEGLAWVVSHGIYNDHGESKWYQHIGKKTASHSWQCFEVVFLALSKCLHKFCAFT